AAGQRELRPPAVVEAARLEARLRVAGLAGRDRLAELGEAVAVGVVVGVAGRARALGLAGAERLGVAGVAGELAVGAGEREARARPVVEAELLEAAEGGRVAPVAGLGVEEV